MRNLEAPQLFETFLIAAIATVLLIRGFLHLTGFPTLGVGTLHIAHVLWGGVLMLVALVLLLGWLGRPAKQAAAVVGGVGWGTFVDELGKFVTRDNDYFYRPTFALIYVSFIALYLVFQALHRREPTRNEAVANALDLLLEAVRRDMDPTEQKRARELLAHCDQNDPLVATISRAVAGVRLVRPARPSLIRRVRIGTTRLYRWLVRQRWFATGVIVFFIAHSANAIIQAIAVVQEVTPSLVLLLAGLLLAALLLHPGHPERATRLSLPAALAVITFALLAGAAIGHTALPTLSLFAWAEIASTVVPAVFVLVGAARMPRSRLEAYRIWRTAVLILLFITQFFTFYHHQLAGMIGLLANIIIAVTLRTMIEQEERLVPARRQPPT